MVTMGTYSCCNTVQKKLGYEVETTLISLEEDFNAEDFDIVMFGGGQDFEQTVVAKDPQK